MDGCWSNLVNVVLECIRAVFNLDPLLFLQYTSELFSVIKMLYGDDSTLVVVVPPQLDRVAVADTLNRDLNRVSELYDFSEMRLNASKSKTMIVSRSRTNVSWPELLSHCFFLSSMGWLCGVGVFALIECIHSLPPLPCRLLKIIIIIIIKIVVVVLSTNSHGQYF